MLVASKRQNREKGNVCLYRRIFRDAVSDLSSYSHYKFIIIATWKAEDESSGEESYSDVLYSCG